MLTLAAAAAADLEVYVVELRVREDTKEINIKSFVDNVPMSTSPLANAIVTMLHTRVALPYRANLRAPASDFTLAYLLFAVLLRARVSAR